MVVVLFRSRLTEEAGADYAAMAVELRDRAARMPGFVDFKSFSAEDGERVSVIHWQSAESMRAWTDDMRHAIAQRLGREKWYTEFSVEVAEVTRSYRFDRDPK